MRRISPLDTVISESRNFVTGNDCFNSAGYAFGAMRNRVSVDLNRRRCMALPFGATLHEERSLILMEICSVNRAKASTRLSTCTIGYLRCQQPFSVTRSNFRFCEGAGYRRRR
jgi:hypothetical protein